MIRTRQDTKAQAWGTLKTYGIRLGTVTQGRNRTGFRGQFKATAGDTGGRQSSAVSGEEHFTWCLVGLSQGQTAGPHSISAAEAVKST
jgi:hypothetical protein